MAFYSNDSQQMSMMDRTFFLSEREKRLNELRVQFENNLLQNRIKLMDRITANDIKIKNQKLEHTKQLHIKFNKLNMSREDRKDRVIRKERIKDFQRTQKMDKIIERMKRIDNLQKDRYLLEEERRKIEDEIHTKKKKMQERLKIVMKNNKNLSKEEIMDFVFEENKLSKTPVTKGNTII